MIPFGLNIYFTIHEIKMKEPRVQIIKPGPAPCTGSLSLDQYEENPLD